MTIGNVRFPEPLIGALRDRKLVVFAGAGVSMGPPANLPDFKGLAKNIAEGTGTIQENQETIEQYLGRLHDNGTDVHNRAARAIADANPKATPVHRDLLRLYSMPGDIRLVTTNFDLLFEEAASDALGSYPEAFPAPALPLGNRFRGIVHLHGSINDPDEMILTHRDFGRAYLTESDGWARRFLVELFGNFAILFVGYSHNDTIMNYLTPSMPRYDSSNRFALIGDKTEDPERWHSLGITPFTFRQEDERDFSGFAEGLGGLSNFMQRGVLDWHREISEIARGTPPVDPEMAGKVEHSLGDPLFLRFFVNSADKPEWIQWLHSRHHLKIVVSGDELSEIDAMLANWLARQFLFSHADDLFRLLHEHAGRLNPRFWNYLAYYLCEGDQYLCHSQTFSRWFLFLMSTAPLETEKSVFLKLAGCCKSLNLVNHLPRIYDAMTAPYPMLRPAAFPTHGQLDIYNWQKLRDECLIPSIPEIGPILLELTVRRLQERHTYLTVWDRAREDYDPGSWHRPAIEPHHQNRFLYVQDLLTDVARDCLNWMARHDKGAVAQWSGQYVASNVPLLRRLAIHTLAERTDLSSDEKLTWLMSRVILWESSARHEIFHVAAQAYPEATPQIKSEFVNTILTYKPAEGELPSTDEGIDYQKYNWLVWLNRADPDCTLVNRELESIQGRHSDFLPREEPDLNVSIQRARRIRGKLSPWNVLEILEQPVAKWLKKALAESPQMHDTYPRDQLIDYVSQAAGQDPKWGLMLADQIGKENKWNTPLLQAVIEGWTTATLDENTLTEVFIFLAASELHESHFRTIAQSLETLIVRNREVVTEETLLRANTVAKHLWHHIPSVDPLVNSDLSVRADNHPAGKLARFWLQSIVLWKSSQDALSDTISIEQREALFEIVEDKGVGGTLGKVQLTRDFHYLAHADEEWTRLNLIPLLDPSHPDFAPAWEGLTESGLFTPQSAEMLRQPFLEAIGRVNQELSGAALEGFIAKYTQMVAFFATEADDEWIMRLFGVKDSSWNLIFALEIGRLLNFLNDEQQREWWQRWIKGYWENRLQGVPLPLDQTETNNMLDWTLKLTGVFPETVELAIQMPLISNASPAIFLVRKDDVLPERWPSELARLLIRMGSSDHKPWGPVGIEPIILQLLQQHLPEHIRLQLNEIKVRHAIGFT